MKPKTATLACRLEPQELERFRKACKANAQNPGEVIRRLAAAYTDGRIVIGEKHNG